MNTAAAPQDVVLPSSPYPGLRPFLDHEDMLMNGRQTQVAEIVARLGRARRPAAARGELIDDDAPPVTRFVAVIGGSGSGKSSLIRAGVVPYLRQYGIPEAGDLWEIVVATPGTNFQPDADGQVRESPITRLARKFERVLRGPHDATRCAAIEQALRRPGGLGRMVELFGAELDLPAGVRPEDACVLLVIDQFAELFHKTNLGRPDAAQLVERVIDHYHQARTGGGHGKCYLAITMRSEHLNDCAGYLGLPEAINAGSYLVSRLDEAQMREVIERPAQRLLRLRQREREVLLRRAPDTDPRSLPPLPRQVVFEQAVIDRLSTDARRLANDPDHLPLLQHALARTWEAACARQGLPETGVPEAITLPDLWRAAQADSEAPLEEEHNVLQLSLDRWAQHVLDSHADDERPVALELMRRLAYKDSRTGTYNQQRLHVAYHPLGAAGLKALLKGRWIDGVDYLFWDDEDPQRVTLKVSHESFIRGWKTLRKLADVEADRLEQYVELLSATRSWLDHGRQDRDLLEARLLARLDDARIEDAIGPLAAEHDADEATATWHDWHRWLAQSPRGAALQALSRQEVRDCVRRSHQLLDERERAAREQHDQAIKAMAEADKARAEAAEAQARAEAADAQVRTEQAEARADKQRQLGRMRIFGLIVIGTSLVAAFAFVVLVPVTVRAQHYFHAAGLANDVTPSVAQERLGGSLGDLAKLIRAADHLQLADRPAAASEPWTALTASWADRLLALPGLRQLNLARLLADASDAVEPVVIRQLRQVLAQSLWLVAPDQLDAATRTAAGPSLAMRCRDERGEQSGQVTLEGGPRPDDAVRRAVFVAADASAGDTWLDSRAVHAASVRYRGGKPSCQLGSRLYTLPAPASYQAPPAAVLLDASLGHMLVVASSERAGADPLEGAAETVQVLRLRWHADRRRPEANLSGPLAVLTQDADAAALLRQQAQGQADGAAAAGGSWQTTAGRAVQVGPALAWQWVTPSAHRLEPAAADLRPLQDRLSGGGCADIANDIQADFKAYFEKNKRPDEAFEPLELQALAADARHCLILQRSHLHGPLDSAAASAGNARDQVSLQVFRLPAAGHTDGLRTADTARLLATLEFGRVPHDQRPWQWTTGTAGSAWDGWLILQRPPAQGGGPPSSIGLPWSTSALARLAQDLRRAHCAAWAAGGQGPSGQPAECAPGWPHSPARTTPGG